MPKSHFSTNGLVWMAQNLGVVGYAVFSGLQQLVVITGLHHIFGAIEAQLLADTGRNFINPLMSVAIIAQGGAVLGYLLRHRDNAKTIMHPKLYPRFVWHYRAGIVWD